MKAPVTFPSQGDVRPRVLLVDDERFFRDSLYTLFESDGYEVLAAGDGRDGLAIFRQSMRPIDLLVTDWNMPSMNGLELVRACSQLDPELAAIYISGSRPDAEMEADVRNGRRAFVAKPFRGAELLRQAKALLAAEPARCLSRSA